MKARVPKEAVPTRIAYRIAREFMALRRKQVVNLGVGIPTLVSRFLEGDEICLQAENGLLGVGPAATGSHIDPQLINAGRQPVTETAGCCYFDSAASFGMIRGGHVDATVIGALQVDQTGSIANWILPNGSQLGVGGAMDLVSGVKQVIVAMRHLDRDGRPKLVKRCSLPVTGYHEADMVVTELAVFIFKNRQMILTEIAPELDLNELTRLTEAEFEVARDVKIMAVKAFEPDAEAE